MYICICKAVSEADLIKQLTTDEPTLEKLQDSCGAGTDCGSCTRKMMRLIERHVSGSSSEGNEQNKNA